MRIHFILIALMLATSACSSSKSQQKSDESMTDEQYSDAMEKEHSDEKPDPSGAESQSAGTLEVAGETVSYAEVDGAKVNGYFVAPEAEGDYPGVIVIHEWWGLNDNIRSMADKLASHGYRALAVDMYGGEVAETPDQAKKLMMAVMQNPGNGVANLEAARTYLEGAGATEFGVIGWCFGGGWSLQAGLTQPDELDAVVMYYGRVKTTKEEVAPLEAPLLGIFAAEDQGIPVEQVKQFEKALEAAGEDAEIHVYDGVGHAFANPSGDAYSKEAAEDAWDKTIAFFAEHLGN